MTYGKTFKRIRKNKNLPQTYFTNSRLSQSMISYFENGNRKLDSENFIFMLEKINMTFEEFVYLHQNYKLTEKQLILKNYSQLIFNDELKIMNLTQMCKDYLSNNYDIYIQHILIISQGLLKLSIGKNIKDARKIIKPIWEYYEKLDNWYLEDLKLINSILFIFKDDLALSVANTLLNRLNKFETIHLTKDLAISIRTNITILLMESKEWEKAIILIEKNLNDYQKEMNYLILTAHYNRLAICLEKLGANRKIINDYLEKVDLITTTLGDVEFKNKLHKEYLTIMNSEF